MKPYNKNTEKILRLIMWDYHIEALDIYYCLSGTNEYAGFYTKTELLIKAFNNLNYTQLISLFDLNEIKQVLTNEFIQKLRFEDIKLKYEILRKILYRETLPPSKWDNRANKFPQYTILSNRWYSSQSRVL